MRYALARLSTTAVEDLAVMLRTSPPFRPHPSPGTQLLCHAQPFLAKHEEGLEDFFDATDIQLQRVWQRLPPSQRGTYASIAALMQFFGLADQFGTDKLGALARAADTDDSGGLSFGEFSSCAHVLKLCALRALGGSGGGRLLVADYSLERVDVLSDIAPARRSAWFHGQRPPGCHRWVHLSHGAPRSASSDPQCDGLAHSLKLLAAKFRVHPVALEDALDAVGGKRPRAKCTVHGSGPSGCILVIFPVPSVISQASAPTSERGAAIAPISSPPELEIKPFGFLVPLTAASHLDSLVSFATRPRRGTVANGCAQRTYVDVRDACDVGRDDAADVPLSLGADSHSLPDGPEGVALAKVLRALSRGFSSLRSGDCSLLLHGLLDALVDGLDPALAALEEAVDGCLVAVRSPSRLRQAGIAAHAAHVHRLQRTVHELDAAMKPLARVMQNLRVQLVHATSQRAARSTAPPTPSADGAEPQIDAAEDVSGGDSEPAAAVPPSSPNPGAASLGAASPGAASPGVTPVPTRGVLPCPAPASIAPVAAAYDRLEEELEGLFADMSDRIEFELFRIATLIKSSDQLEGELRQAIDLQTNQVLNTLTILSAIFVPANFLAAVWGMNFVDMPELHWKWGYSIFWALVVAMWVGFGLWYCGRRL